MSHHGIAVIDVISPCVTFANNDEFFRSYGYVKENETELHSPDYIPHHTPVEEVDIPAGEYQDIELFDGAKLRLETVGDEHDPSDPVAALASIHKAEMEKKHVTGLLYFDAEQATLDEELRLSDTPLVNLSDDEMRPNEQALADLLAEFRS